MKRFLHFIRRLLRASLFILRDPKAYLAQALARRVDRGSRWYDAYYRHFSDRLQGSILGRYRRPRWRRGARHVLIFSNRYWLIHAAVEMAFAKERQMKGWNVTVVGCDTAIDTCDNMMFGRVKPYGALTHRCSYCSILLRRMCRRCGVHFVSIRDYLRCKKLENDIPPKARDYARLTYVSWVRLLRSLHPKEEAEWALHHSLIASCRRIDVFLAHYLDRNPVDQVIMLNGKFFGEQLLSEHCRERGIPFLTYERGLVKETLMFAVGKPAIPPDTGERWERRKAIPLTAAQQARLRTYLGERKVLGNAESIPFYASLTEDGQKLCRAFHLDPGRPLVVLFTNSIWDSSVVSEDTIFSDMFDWITTCIQHYASSPETQFVIRVHPVECRISPHQQTRDRVDAYVAAHHGGIANVTVIPPEADASPYTLMDLARLGLVYTSSAGLEMAVRGKPVIVASRAHYAGTEFVHTPSSREEFLRLIADPPGPMPNQVEYAERYAFMYYFEHMIDYSDLIQQLGVEFRFLKPLTEAHILERAGL